MQAAPINVAEADSIIASVVDDLPWPSDRSRLEATKAITQAQSDTALLNRKRWLTAVIGNLWAGVVPGLADAIWTDPDAVRSIPVLHVLANYAQEGRDQLIEAVRALVLIAKATYNETPNPMTYRTLRETQMLHRVVGGLELAERLIDCRPEHRIAHIVAGAVYYAGSSQPSELRRIANAVAKAY